jgi:catechol 2,3-dioxygenase-like lactoylglutathione lyase family enzyme
MTMHSLTTIETGAKFHLSLNVPDLARAVDFYSLLFGMKPAKRHDDYAKFELDDPPVVFSLVPHPPGPGASLSHLGIRAQSDETLQRFRERLEAAGICTQSQDGTVCGYARQNNLWVKDPFGNFWEIYRIEEDVRPEMVRKSLEGAAARIDTESCVAPPEATVVWEHFVTNPMPERIPHDNSTVDEVRLVGTFNSDLSESQRTFLLTESARVLKPGGKLLTHGLMSDRPFPGAQPKLAGLAAMVSRVPTQSEPIVAFRQAGFVGIQVVKYTEKPWFTHDGVELREVKLLAWKPGDESSGEKRQVLYKGPFARIKADGGYLFERGQRVAVPQAMWQQLRRGATAEQFLFFEPGQKTEC